MSGSTRTRGRSGILTAASPQARQNFGTIEFYGHSLTYGGSSDGALRGGDGRIAAMLPAEDYNRTRGGAILANHASNPWSTTGNGGWAHIYRFIEQELAADISSGVPAYEQAGGYEAKRDYCQVWYGINDLAKLGPANLTPFQNALVAVISRLRAAIIFEEDDASVTYPTGVWTPTVGGTEPAKFQSAGSYMASDSSGGSVRIAVPASFPGGTVALAFLCAATGAGAAWSFTVDGVAAGTADSRNANSQDYLTGLRPYVTPVVKRLTGLAAGAHTIVATTTAVNAAALFDCWWVEARTSPMIAVPLANRPVTYALWSNPANWPYQPTDADIPTLNAIIQAAVNQFDADVFTIDLDTTLAKNSAYFASDGAHLNDYGHALAAALIVSAIALRARALDKHTAGSVTPPFISRNPWNTLRNVIQAVQPDQIPLSVYGRNAGDQTAVLQAWYSFGASAPAIIELGRILGTPEFDAGVAGRANQIVNGTQPGDAAIKGAPNQAFFLGLGTTPFLQAILTGAYQTQGVQVLQALIALSKDPALYARVGVGRTAEEAQHLIVALADQGFVGSAAGDSVLRNLNAGAATHIGVNTTRAMKITETGITFMQAVYDAIMPWTVSILPTLAAEDASTKVGTWAATQSSSQSGGYLWNSSVTQNDQIGWDVLLAAGTWRLSLLFFKTATSAIATVLLDTVSQGTLDLYAAGNTFDQTGHVDFTVATSGKHTIALKAATRNASSTGWQLAFSGLQLRRTA